MEIMDFVIFAAGFIAGWVMLRLSKPAGILRIDHSNPEKDVYRMEFDDLDSLSKKTRIVLKVDNHASLSQK